MLISFVHMLYVFYLISLNLLRRLVQTMDYSVIVFDTAPTGHTLRLLQFPSTLEKGLAKMMTLKNRFGGLISQVKYKYCEHNCTLCVTLKVDVDFLH